MDEAECQPLDPDHQTKHTQRELEQIRETEYFFRLPEMLHCIQYNYSDLLQSI